VKIAFLVSQYPTINHTFILREIRRLRSQGFDIPVVSIRPPDRPLERMQPEEREEASRTASILGASWGKILAAHLATLFRRPAGYLRGVAAALRMGRFHPAETLRHLLYLGEAVVAGHWMMAKGVTHFHTHFSSTVGLLAVRVFPLTMSMTIHGSGEFNDPIGFALAAKVAASRFVCAISSFGRSQLMKSCDPADWSKIEVSLLGVDAAAFRPRPFCESPDVFEILWVGSLTPARGQRLLVNAAGELLRQGRRLRLHLVGDGEDRAALEAHAAALGLHDAVVFHGWLNQDQVRSLYERADLFALASFAEGIPVVLMEAMAMEIPCVATYIAGIPELIRDGESGLLVHASDAAALAAAIARLMDQPELRRQLGKAGREKVLADFDLARNMAKLAGIFRRRLAE